MNPLLGRRMRALTERECYLRLHGHRSGLVRFVGSDSFRSQEAGSHTEQPLALESAVHAGFRYPRSGSRMSGEELRLDLLRRMQSRSAA